MKSVRDANIKKGTRVLVRCDLDVPLSEHGNILETFRLDHMVATLELIKEKDGFPIIMGHMGRPKGKVVDKLKTGFLSPYFIKKLGANNFELLENLRFDPREKANDVSMAREIIKNTLAEIYVNESFATSHRQHTSMVQFPKLLPSFMGLRLEKEINVLDNIYSADAIHPIIAIVGGAKLESKKPVVQKFLEKSDGVLIGGTIGLNWDGNKPENLFLPLDYARENKDIGQETAKRYAQIISTAKTIVWSGPMGLYEEELFITGTSVVGEAVANSGAYSIIGGGDTITALNKLGLLDKMSFVSTGGGAMLEFLVKGTLPALEALKENA